MRLESWKENVGSLWENLTEGWRHLRDSAASALTSFRPGETTNLPSEAEVGDSVRLTGRGWAMLGGDLFEDEARVVIRLEMPGMAREDINIEVLDDALVMSGEKRFEGESSRGHWRVVQCAYGSFRRVVPLPVPVRAEQARATYRNGVLRVELPKADPGKPRGVSVTVE